MIGLSVAPYRNLSGSVGGKQGERPYSGVDVVFTGVQVGASHTEAFARAIADDPLTSRRPIFLTESEESPGEGRGLCGMSVMVYICNMTGAAAWVDGLPLAPYRSLGGPLC